jgi:hypothetical protein
MVSTGFQNEFNSHLEKTHFVRPNHQKSQKKCMLTLVNQNLHDKISQQQNAKRRNWTLCHSFWQCTLYHRSLEQMTNIDSLQTKNYCSPPSHSHMYRVWDRVTGDSNCVRVAYRRLCKLLKLQIQLSCQKLSRIFSETCWRLFSSGGCSSQIMSHFSFAGMFDLAYETVPGWVFCILKVIVHLS